MQPDYLRKTQGEIALHSKHKNEKEPNKLIMFG